MAISVNPIFPIGKENKKGGLLFWQKAIDLKVRGFVLERMSQASGGLLPSASSPEMIMSLLPDFESSKFKPYFKEKRKAKLHKTPLLRMAPIGLTPADPEGLLNSLMQFILHVPGFAEGFAFAPRSWFLVQEFIDQYHYDQFENKSTSSAESLILLYFLKQKIIYLSLNEICRSFFRLLNLSWEIQSHFNEELPGKNDLFVTENPLKKQIFIGSNLCYDLNAFVEKRPDGEHFHYVTYVKIKGSWYQCDNERITQLRSDSLKIALQRSSLSHYKRISIFIS